jgi:hypothetical protein
MYTRFLTVDLKPGQGPGYAAALDQKIIPILRTFPGFRDEIAGFSPDGKKAFGMSFWETPEQAAAYKRDGYSRVLEAMTPFIQGEPVVVAYDVTRSTVHNILTQTVGV